MSRSRVAVPVLRRTLVDLTDEASGAGEEAYAVVEPAAAARAEAAARAAAAAAVAARGQTTGGAGSGDGVRGAALFGRGRADSRVRGAGTRIGSAQGGFGTGTTREAGAGGAGAGAGGQEGPGAPRPMSEKRPRPPLADVAVPSVTAQSSVPLSKLPRLGGRLRASAQRMGGHRAGLSAPEAQEQFAKRSAALSRRMENADDMPASAGLLSDIPMSWLSKAQCQVCSKPFARGPAVVFDYEDVVFLSGMVPFQALEPDCELRARRKESRGIALLDFMVAAPPAAESLAAADYVKLMTDPDVEGMTIDRRMIVCRQCLARGRRGQARNIFADDLSAYDDPCVTYRDLERSARGSVYGGAAGLGAAGAAGGLQLADRLVPSRMDTTGMAVRNVNSVTLETAQHVYRSRASERSLPGVPLRCIADLPLTAPGSNVDDRFISYPSNLLRETVSESLPDTVKSATTFAPFVMSAELIEIGVGTGSMLELSRALFEFGTELTDLSACTAEDAARNLSSESQVGVSLARKLLDMTQSELRLLRTELPRVRSAAACRALVSSAVRVMYFSVLADSIASTLVNHLRAFVESQDVLRALVPLGITLSERRRIDVGTYQQLGTLMLHTSSAVAALTFNRSLATPSDHQTARKLVNAAVNVAGIVLGQGGVRYAGEELSASEALQSARAIVDAKIKLARATERFHDVYDGITTALARGLSSSPQYAGVVSLLSSLRCDGGPPSYEPARALVDAVASVSEATRRSFDSVLLPELGAAGRLPAAAPEVGRRVADRFERGVREWADSVEGTAATSAVDRYIRRFRSAVSDVLEEAFAESVRQSSLPTEANKQLDVSRFMSQLSDAGVLPPEETLRPAVTRSTGSAAATSAARTSGRGSAAEALYSPPLHLLTSALTWHHVRAASGESQPEDASLPTQDVNRLANVAMGGARVVDISQRVHDLRGSAPSTPVSHSVQLYGPRTGLGTWRIPLGSVVAAPAPYDACVHYYVFHDVTTEAVAQTEPPAADGSCAAGAWRYSRAVLRRIFPRALPGTCTTASELVTHAGDIAAAASRRMYGSEEVRAELRTLSCFSYAAKPAAQTVWYDKSISQSGFLHGGPMLQSYVPANVDKTDIEFPLRNNALAENLVEREMRRRRDPAQMRGRGRLTTPDEAEFRRLLYSRASTSYIKASTVPFGYGVNYPMREMCSVPAEAGTPLVEQTDTDVAVVGRAQFATLTVDYGDGEMAALTGKVQGSGSWAPTGVLYDGMYDDASKVISCATAQAFVYHAVSQRRTSVEEAKLRHASLSFSLLEQLPLRPVYGAYFILSNVEDVCNTLAQCLPDNSDSQLPDVSARFGSADELHDAHATFQSRARRILKQAAEKLSRAADEYERGLATYYINAVTDVVSVLSTATQELRALYEGGRAAASESAAAGAGAGAEAVPRMTWPQAAERLKAKFSVVTFTLHNFFALAVLLSDWSEREASTGADGEFARSLSEVLARYVLPAYATCQDVAAQMRHVFDVGAAQGERLPHVLFRETYAWFEDVKRLRDVVGSIRKRAIEVHTALPSSVPRDRCEDVACVAAASSVAAYAVGLLVEASRSTFGWSAGGARASFWESFEQVRASPAAPPDGVLEQLLRSVSLTADQAQQLSGSSFVPVVSPMCAAGYRCLRSYAEDSARAGERPEQGGAGSAAAQAASRADACVVRDAAYRLGVSAAPQGGSGSGWLGDVLLLVAHSVAKNEGRWSARRDGEGRITLPIPAEVADVAEVARRIGLAGTDTGAASASDVLSERAAAFSQLMQRRTSTPAGPGVASAAVAGSGRWTLSPSDYVRLFAAPGTGPPPLRWKADGSGAELSADQMFHVVAVYLHLSHAAGAAAAEGARSASTYVIILRAALQLVRGSAPCSPPTTAMMNTYAALLDQGQGLVHGVNVNELAKGSKALAEREYRRQLFLGIQMMTAASDTSDASVVEMKRVLGFLGPCCTDYTLRSMTSIRSSHDSNPAIQTAHDFGVLKTDAMYPDLARTSSTTGSYMTCITYRLRNRVPVLMIGRQNPYTFSDEYMNYYSMYAVARYNLIYAFNKQNDAFAHLVRAFSLDEEPAKVDLNIVYLSEQIAVVLANMPLCRQIVDQARTTDLSSTVALPCALYLGSALVATYVCQALLGNLTDVSNVLLYIDSAQDPATMPDAQGSRVHIATEGMGVQSSSSLSASPRRDEPEQDLRDSYIAVLFTIIIMNIPNDYWPAAAGMVRRALPQAFDRASSRTVMTNLEALFMHDAFARNRNIDRSRYASAEQFVDALHAGLRDPFVRASDGTERWSAGYSFMGMRITLARQSEGLSDAASRDRVARTLDDAKDVWRSHTSQASSSRRRT